MIAGNPSEPPSPIPISAQYARAFDDDDPACDNGVTCKEPIKRAQLFGKKGSKNTKKGRGLKKVRQLKGKGKAKAKVVANIEVQASKTSEVPKPSSDAGSGMGLYQPHLYSERYRVFVQAAMQNGATCNDAKGQRLSSQDRANLLADMPLPELKRRRFVCKECKANPFVRVNPKAALGGC